MDHKSESKPQSKAVRYLPVLLVVTMTILLGLPLVVISMPQAVRIPVIEDHDGDPEAAALFSHWSHNQFKCYTCHWAIFPMAKKGFTHWDMEDGKYCASCHDGGVAWDMEGDDVDCVTCHVPEGYGFVPYVEEDEEEEEVVEEDEAEEEGEEPAADESEPVEPPAEEVADDTDDAASPDEALPPPPGTDENVSEADDEVEEGEEP